MGRVDRINDFEYDLFVRPDLANPRFRFWFNFTIENVQSGQVRLCRLIFLLSYNSFFHVNTLENFVEHRKSWKKLPTFLRWLHSSHSIDIEIQMVNIVKFSDVDIAEKNTVGLTSMNSILVLLYLCNTGIVFQRNMYFTTAVLTTDCDLS